MTATAPFLANAHAQAAPIPRAAPGPGQVIGRSVHCGACYWQQKRDDGQLCLWIWRRVGVRGGGAVHVLADAAKGPVQRASRVEAVSP